MLVAVLVVCCEDRFAPDFLEKEMQIKESRD